MATFQSRRFPGRAWYPKFGAIADPVYRTSSNAKPFKYSVSGIIGITG